MLYWCEFTKILYCLSWLIINKPQPNLYSGDTCLGRSREGVPTLAEKTHDCVTVNCHVLSLSYSAPPSIYRGVENVCVETLYR